MIIEETKNYRLHKDGEQEYLTFPRLDEFTNLKHLFTTRKGGVSSGCCESWNFGARSFDDEENISKNYQILGNVLGVSPERMTASDQTHTINIRRVTAADAGKGVTREKDYRDIDGLVTDAPGITLITGHADCNAIYFFEPEKKIIGLAHSGWKGTLGGIGAAMAEIMVNEYGCRAENIIAGIGPSLCRDCFEVDEDVAQAFFKKNSSYQSFACRSGIKTYIDLKKLICSDLQEAGLVQENLLNMGFCTKCRNDLFFSHRGQRGKRGIMAAAMMLQE